MCAYGAPSAQLQPAALFESLGLPSLLFVGMPSTMQAFKSSNSNLKYHRKGKAKVNSKDSKEFEARYLWTSHVHPNHDPIEKVLDRQSAFIE